MRQISSVLQRVLEHGQVGLQIILQIQDAGDVEEEHPDGPQEAGKEFLRKPKHNRASFNF